jgi:hypothetical protein
MDPAWVEEASWNLRQLASPRTHGREERRIFSWIQPQFLTLWPWVRYKLALSLGFLSCKMRMLLPTL